VGLLPLIVAAIFPPAVSAASCRLTDPVVLRNIEYRGIRDNAVTLGDGRISGSGGCNRYSAAVLETGPGGLSIGPAASTKMACPDPAGGFEDRYFSALQEAHRFGFLLGNLVLHYGKWVGQESMIFEREGPR